LNFESELRQGRFTVGECNKCHRISWPPSDFCNNCFGNLQYRPVKEPGILLESSAKDGNFFGIVKFEDSIKVIGKIDSNIEQKPGQMMKIASCGFDKSPKFTFTKS